MIAKNVLKLIQLKEMEIDKKYKKINKVVYGGNYTLKLVPHVEDMKIDMAYLETELDYLKDMLHRNEKTLSHFIQ